MKYVLIITSETGGSNSWRDRKAATEVFCQAVNEQLDDITVVYTTYQALMYELRSGELDIFDSINDCPLRKFDFVQFKNWRFESEEASLIARYLNDHGISYVNEDANLNLNKTKFNQLFTLSKKAVPVPDTIFAKSPMLMSSLKSGLPEGFTYPVILKDNDGSKGDFNYLVKSYDELCSRLEQNSSRDFIIENYIPNDGDLRILFIGFDNTPLVFERKAVSGSHLNNTSKGGSGTFKSYESLPLKIRQDAKAAAQTLNLEISGVDVLIDSSNGKHYILEVNATPAIATGFGTEEKTHLFATFIRQQVEGVEEE